MFKTSPVNYNEIVKTAPQKVLDNPQCAYLLDADVDTTDLLQKAFGIICQSTSRLKDCILTSPQSKITLLESEQLRSWKDLFNDGIAIPSNSLPFIVITVESFTCPLYDFAFNLMVKYDPIRLHSCFIRFPFYFMKEKFFQQFFKPFYMFL